MVGNLGLATISLYLFEGIIGLPVFSGTPEKGIGLFTLLVLQWVILIGFIVADIFLENLIMIII